MVAEEIVFAELPQQKRQKAPLPATILATAGLLIGFAAGSGFVVLAIKGNAISLKPLAAVGGPIAETQKIKSCAWWSKPPTDAQVEAFIDKCQTLNHNDTIYINRNGDTAILTAYYKTALPSLKAPWVKIEASGGSRPDRRKWYKELLSGLEFCEYRDGAGR